MNVVEAVGSAAGILLSPANDVLDEDNAEELQKTACSYIFRSISE